MQATKEVWEGMAVDVWMRTETTSQIFCGNSNLVISGTLFQHKDIHKLTWVSPGGRDINQIDLITINGKGFYKVYE